MKAQDLRIGNIIHDPNKGVDGYTYVTSRTIHALDSHPCDFQPIPLTPEWLERLGFEKVKDINEHSYPDWTLGIVTLHQNVHGFFVLADYKGMICIHHVHQLQNLYFALTGEELTVSEKESGLVK